MSLIRTDFIITASADGHVKFWKKNEGEGIEFVKHFRGHLGKNILINLWILLPVVSEKLPQFCFKLLYN